MRSIDHAFQGRETIAMKRAIAFTVLCLMSALLFPAVVGAAEKDCFTLVANEWKICKPDSKKQGLVLKVKNICVETMQLKLCIEKEGGEWDCKWFREIKKESEVEMTSCDNTGNYKIIACEDIDDCKRKSMTGP